MGKTVELKSNWQNGSHKDKNKMIEGLLETVRDQESKLAAYDSKLRNYVNEEAAIKKKKDHMHHLVLGMVNSGITSVQDAYRKASMIYDLLNKELKEFYEKVDEVSKGEQEG